MLHIRWFRLASLLIFVVASGWLAAAQPLPQGTLYMTRAESNGEILKPFDLGPNLDLGLFQPIVQRVSLPEDVLCGPDGRLYFNENFAQKDNRRFFNRIWRVQQDGAGRTLVAEWDSQNLRPASMVFAANGDLYFGTVSTESNKPTQGIWRIPGALQASREFSTPELVLPPDVFLEPSADTIFIATPYAFLSAGPFAGDLLLVDAPNEESIPGDRVLRALQPDFASVVEFISPFNDEETGSNFSPIGLALASNGDVLVADFGNNKVLRYAPDGVFKDIFALVESPNQIAVGPDGYVYVTNASFSDNGVVRGGLYIFNAEGTPIKSVQFPLFLRGVTVCASE